MNQIYTIDKLISILKENDFFKDYGDNCRSIVISFFNTIIDALKNDDSVSIKDFGEFRVINRENGVILFTPAQSLADTINEPFAFFEPIELSDLVTDEMLESAKNDIQDNSDDIIKAETDEPEPIALTEASAAITSVSENNEGENLKPEDADITEVNHDLPALEPELPSDNQNETEEDLKPEDESVSNEDSNEQDSDNTEENTPEIEADEIDEYEPVIKRGHSTTSLISFIILSLAIGFVIGLFTAEYVFVDDETEDQSSEELTEQIEQLRNELLNEDKSQALESAIDSVVSSSEPKVAQSLDNSDSQTPTAPAETAKVITDTVTSNHFLTHMSRKYYGGAMEFWVYIYLENQDKLGHPDRIKPNTVVVIPPAEKYGIDPNSQKSRDAAKQKAAEIYSKYK